MSPSAQPSLPNVPRPTSLTRARTEAITSDHIASNRSWVGQGQGAQIASCNLASHSSSIAYGHGGHGMKSGPCEPFDRCSLRSAQRSRKEIAHSIGLLEKLLSSRLKLMSARTSNAFIASLPDVALLDDLSDGLTSDTSGAGDLSLFGTAHGGTHDHSVAVAAQRREVAMAVGQVPSTPQVPSPPGEQFGVSPVHGHGPYIPTHLWGYSLAVTVLQSPFPYWQASVPWLTTHVAGDLGASSVELRR